MKGRNSNKSSNADLPEKSTPLFYDIVKAGSLTVFGDLTLKEEALYDAVGTVEVEGGLYIVPMAEFVIDRKNSEGLAEGEMALLGHLDLSKGGKFTVYDGDVIILKGSNIAGQVSIDDGQKMIFRGGNTTITQDQSHIAGTIFLQNAGTTLALNDRDLGVANLNVGQGTSLFASGNNGLQDLHNAGDIFIGSATDLSQNCNGMLVVNGDYIGEKGSTLHFGNIAVTEEDPKNPLVAGHKDLLWVKGEARGESYVAINGKIKDLGKLTKKGILLAHIEGESDLALSLAPGQRVTDGGTEYLLVGRAELNDPDLVEGQNSWYLSNVKEVPAEPPVEIPTENPVETPAEPPVEIPTENPVETPAEPPVEIPTENPVETPAEPPVEIPAENPVEPPVEIPTENPVETPVETPVELPVEIPAETPVETPVELPVEIPAETPVETPAEPPVEIPAETPVETPAEPPVEIPTENPVEIPAEPPVEIPTETPVETPVDDDLDSNNQAEQPIVEIPGDHQDIEPSEPITKPDADNPIVTNPDDLSGDRTPVEDEIPGDQSTDIPVIEDEIPANDEVITEDEVIAEDETPTNDEVIAEDEAQAEDEQKVSDDTDLASANPKPIILAPESASYLTNLILSNEMFSFKYHDRQYVDGYEDIWVSAKATFGSYKTAEDRSLKSDFKSFTLHIGKDIWQQDQFIAGVMAAYGYSNGSSQNHYTGKKADHRSTGFALGAYGHYQFDENNQRYIDLWAQYVTTHNRVTGQGQSTDSYRARGWIAAIEAGYELNLSEKVTLQPQGQLTWFNVKDHHHTMMDGTKVSSESGNLQTRLGARLTYQGVRLQPFAEVNYIRNSKPYRIHLQGELNQTRIEATGSRNLYQVELGVQMKQNRNWTTSGSVSMTKGKDSYKNGRVKMDFR